MIRKWAVPGAKKQPASSHHRVFERAAAWNIDPNDDPTRFNTPLDEEEVVSEFVGSTPSSEELLRLADEHPPAKEWYHGDEPKPF
jgi:hypothetical protein